MTVTIDKAGRVVIPVEVRRRVGFRPGTPLEIRCENGVVSLSRDVPPPRLEERGGRLVAKASANTRPALNVATLVEEERDRWPQ